MNTNHTTGKLPWKTVESGSIYDAGFHHLGHFPQGENAKLAVESVNHFPALLAALEGILESCPEIAGFGQDDFRDAINTARTVIAQAKGEQS